MAAGERKEVAMAAGQKASAVMDAIANVQTWYDTNWAQRERLARMTLELVSACPSQVHVVCEELVKALATGTEMVKAIRLGDRSFESREELKAETQALLRKYPDNATLDEADAQFVMLLLAQHPRGQEKAKGCTSISCGPHPTFAVRCFFVHRADGREDFSYLRCIDNCPTDEIEAQQHICKVLCAILQLHPSACEKTVRTFEERFPQCSTRNRVEKHRNWSKSLLYVCSNIAQVTEFLLIVFIRQLVDIDTRIHKMEEALPPNTTFGDQALETGDKAKEEEFDHMAQILDANMMLLFEFLQRHLTGQVVGEAENTLAKCLLSVFEGTVLLTPRVRCVQFLWFYFASLRPAWAEAFLSLLLQTAYSPVHNGAKRVISFAYLASFVSRAGFLTTKYSLRTLQYIVTFARENMQVAEEYMKKGEMAHPQAVLFLSAVQAACYILCFCTSRFAEEDPQGLQSLLRTGSEPLAAGQEAAFGAILDSPCRPLAHIGPHVAREFLRTISPHQPQLALALQAHIKKHGEVEESGEEVEENKESTSGVDSFFPFDPYRLRHSSMFLLGIYREWSPSGDDSESEADAGGFQAEVRPRDAGSDDEFASDADFTDAADVAERGFIPSVGPSPAFQPRSSMDITDMSPFLAPMEMMVEDDPDFTLPQACVDVGATMLDRLLNTPAYTAGKAVPAGR